MSPPPKGKSPTRTKGPASGGKSAKKATKKATKKSAKKAPKKTAGRRKKQAEDPEPVEAQDVEGNATEEDDEEALTPEVVSAIPLQEDDEAEVEVVEVESRKLETANLSTRSLVPFDPLTAYIQETRRYSLLSREDEHELAVRYVEEDDMAAARRLVTANLRLVVKIAHEYRKAHQNLLDLIQEGNVGLVQAVQKYDPYRGVKLSTYAAWWIRAYILKFILNNWRMVKIGTTQAQRKLFFNLRKQKEELEKMGIQPTASNVARELGVTETEVTEMERRLAAPDLSLSTPLGRDEDGGRTYYDVLPEEDAPPDEQVAGAQFRDLLRDKLAKFAQDLHGRDEVIYRERLMSESPLTLKEIGDKYGVSRERARQLEKRLLNKLRDYLREEMGDAVEVAMGWEN